jgi:transposase
MQKIKYVLRMHLVGGVASCRQLARAVGCGKSAVADCLRRAKVANLGFWSLVSELDEAELSRRLYPAAARTTLSRPATRQLPDWAKVREELTRADHQITLALLWEEYKGQHRNGYQYSQFAELYRRFEKRLSVVLRQPHRAGEKCFVDFCDGLPLYGEHTGERIATELFVGALGASSYTFAWATLSQNLPTWLDCHVRMYEFFSGVSAITVPDNLRSAIKSPNRYEAEINPAYREPAEHYGTCIIPARVRKPRDKGKVEAAVLTKLNSRRRPPAAADRPLKRGCSNMVVFYRIFLATLEGSAHCRECAPARGPTDNRS